MNCEQCCAYLNSLVKNAYGLKPSAFDVDMEKNPVSPGAYMKLACKHIEFEHQIVAMIVVLLYILRFQFRTGISPHRRNVYSLILSATICAEEFYEDDTYGLKYWAETTTAKVAYIAHIKDLMYAANQYRMWIELSLVDSMQRYICSLFEKQAARHLTTHLTTHEPSIQSTSNDLIEMDESEIEIDESDATVDETVDMHVDTDVSLLVPTVS